MKQKFVYIVIRKAFSKNGNYESAFAIDYADVTTLSSLKKAEEFVAPLIKCQDNPYIECVIPENEILAENTLLYKYYAQQTYNRSGIRYGYMILKQVVG